MIFQEVGLLTDINKILKKTKYESQGISEKEKCRLQDCEAEGKDLCDQQKESKI
jgi:hypothetical protein